MKDGEKTDILLLDMCQDIINKFKMHIIEETSCPLNFKVDNYSDQPTRT